MSHDIWRISYRTKIVEKRTRCVLLLQDNAPAHTSQVAMATTTKCSFEFRLHPPYSPDLAPSDFCLLQNLKTNYRYWNFGSNEGIIDAVDENFRDQDEGFYFEGVSKLEQRLTNCMEANGDYIEFILTHSGTISALWAFPKFRD